MHSNVVMRVAVMQTLSKLSRSIAGSVAIVTGAASGMGRATAHLFADEGVRLAILDVNADGLAAVADECRSAGAEVLALTYRGGRPLKRLSWTLRAIVAASIFWSTTQDW